MAPAAPAARAAVRLRPYAAADRDFVLGLVPRFVAFPLPAWRDAAACEAGIRADIAAHLDQRTPGSHAWVAEAAGLGRCGFLLLLEQQDYFTGVPSCHVSDLVVSAGAEGRGVAAALLAHAERWAVDAGCAFLTLAVFEGNARARRLYERAGFGTELLRMTKPLPPPA